MTLDRSLGPALLQLRRPRLCSDDTPMVRRQAAATRGFLGLMAGIGFVRLMLDIGDLGFRALTVVG